ncbi:MAG: IS66 family transposase [Pseudomonadales bacterium]|jgi:transposase|nr:IS66 family transposase [Pseudomonadales bacterium]
MAVDNEQQTESYASIDLVRALELLAEKDEQLSALLHRVRQLEKMVFGPRSAKRQTEIDPSQLLPFPNLQELFEGVVARAEERAEQARQSEVAAPKPKRGKPKRRSLDADIPDHFPRHRRAKKLTEAECACGCGGHLKEFREEVARRIEKISLYYVDERVTTYYACSDCECVISVAPDQDQVVEGGILGPNVIAELAQQRFDNHVPYHRLEREFARAGLPVSRTVIGRSVLKAGELLLPIYQQIRSEVLGAYLVQIDDTPVVVRNGNGKGRQQGRIWVYRNPATGSVFFDFRMDRSSDGPRKVIGNFRGFIQGDAYSGHDFLFVDTFDRIELGCWAHVVRKFRDARDSDKRLAAEFDLLFALLNRIEHECRAMPPPQRFMHRVLHARPVLKEIKDWLDVRHLEVLPKSPMGRAIAYARNHWQALTNYLLDGRITDITNNGAERALRRVALGRKNWMHIGIEDAGQPAVVLMSVMQSCVEQGVNTLDYLRDVLVRVSQPGSASELSSLTPAGWQRSREAEQRVAESRSAITRVVQSLSYTS